MLNSILTQRQYDILKYLLDNRGTFYSSIKLAECFSVSSRTIKSEISCIKQFVNNYKSFKVESIPGQGTRIKVKNNEAFIHDLFLLSKSEFTVIDANDNERNIMIMQHLINQLGYITKEDIMDKYAISESTFYKVYNSIKEIIEPYDLSIKHSQSKGYQIIGEEKNKRTLIARYELLQTSGHIPNNMSNVSVIYNYIADIFFTFEYKITEPILQNISSHVLLMKNRVGRGNIVENMHNHKMDNRKEYHIAEAICTKFIAMYNLTENQFKSEVHLLTLTILGKINYLIDQDMQMRINDFIDYSFSEINSKFGINFESVEKLRLFLVLHLAPLIYRIKSGTQLRNSMFTEVKQEFPHANDISLYFSLLFEERFKLSISEDELSYITLYFNVGIEELNLSRTSKRVLVITHLRTAETVLLRHKLLTWFPNQIMDIKFVLPTEDLEDLDCYDAVFATELYYKKYEGAVTLINLFPNNVDYKRINLALNGYSSSEDIIEKFDKGCFYYGHVESKKETIQILCDNAMTVHNVDTDFFPQYGQES